MVVLIVAIFAYFTRENGFVWYSFALPSPFMRENFEQIYLADFAFIGFLAISAYWLFIRIFGGKVPHVQDFSGIVLGISLCLFLVAAIDFEVGYLPVSSLCSESVLMGGITIETCDYEAKVRNWVSYVAGVLLMLSLMSALLESFKARTDSHDDVGTFL